MHGVVEFAVCFHLLKIFKKSVHSRRCQKDKISLNL